MPAEHALRTRTPERTTLLQLLNVGMRLQERYPQGAPEDAIEDALSQLQTLTTAGPPDPCPDHVADYLADHLAYNAVHAMGMPDPANRRRIAAAIRPTLYTLLLPPHRLPRPHATDINLALWSLR